MIHEKVKAAEAEALLAQVGGKLIMNRGMPNEGFRKEELTALLPLSQELVGEFLKERRLAVLKPSEPMIKTKDQAPRKTEPCWSGKASRLPNDPPRKLAPAGDPLSHGPARCEILFAC